MVLKFLQNGDNINYMKGIYSFHSNLNLNLTIFIVNSEYVTIDENNPLILVPGRYS